MRIGNVIHQKWFPKIPPCALEYQNQAHSLFKAQPAVPIGLAFLFGTIGIVLSPLFGMLGIGLVWIANRNNSRHWRIGIWISFLIAIGNAWMRAPGPPLPMSQSQDTLGREAFTSRDTAMVLNFPLRETPALCPIQVTSGISKNACWAMQLPKDQVCPLPGSIVEFNSVPAFQKGATVPGGFDARDWFRRLGLSGLQNATFMQVIQTPSGRWKLALALRETLGHIFETFIPPSQQALVRSTVLGDMQSLSRQTKIDFQNTGMLHILAISGQHIALMVAIALQAFQFLRIPARWVSLFLGAFLWLYGPATGNSPSVVRSIWMYGFLLPPIFLRKPLSAWSTLATATFFSLALEPEVITHVGWQLSYLATLFLLMYARTCESQGSKLAKWLALPFPKLKKMDLLFKAIGVAWGALILSAVICFGTLPLLAASSHVFMPVTPLANLWTVPLGSGLLTCAFLTCLFAPVPILPHWLGMATGFFAHALTASVHRLAQWQEGLLAIPTWPVLALAIWLFVFLIFPTLTTPGKKWIAFASVCLLSGSFACRQVYQEWQGELRAIVVDVGQGQAILIEMGNQTVLIDVGPQRPDAGFRALLPTLRAWGHNRIDAVLLSHGDADHIGGLETLLDQIPIGQVALGSVWPKDGLWPGLVKILQQKKIPYGRLGAGEEIIRYRHWKLRSLNLGQLDSTNRNNASAVLALEGPLGRLVIPGDIEATTERVLADTLAAYQDGKPLWLVIPHHGSDRTGDTDAIRRMKPEWALISAGEKNRFGHPGPETVAVLQEMGTHIGITSREGSWILTVKRSLACWNPLQVVN